MAGQSEQTKVPVKAGNGPLRRRYPFDLFEEMQEEMARFWGQMGTPAMWPAVRALRRFPRPHVAWDPSVDVYEKDGTLIIKAEIPGVNKDDLQITLDQDRLVIQGERRAEQEVKEQDYYRVERSTGSFYRAITLPFEATPDKIQATYQDGVLELRIPRPAETQALPHKIPIK